MVSRGLRIVFELFWPPTLEDVFGWRKGPWDITLADRWVLCDNTGSSIVIVARIGRDEATAICNEVRFKEVQNAAERE